MTAFDPTKTYGNYIQLMHRDGLLSALELAATEAHMTLPPGTTFGIGYNVYQKSYRETFGVDWAVYHDSDPEPIGFTFFHYPPQLGDSERRVTQS